MRRYMTYFDSHYAARGVAMIESLLNHDRAAAVTVLCLDEATSAVVESELSGRVTTLLPSELDAFEPRLAVAARGRSQWEQIATFKPVVVAWMMDRAEPGQVICFIDADTWFFSDPGPAFAEVAASSIALSPHRYSRRRAPHLAGAGTFNAGFVIWRCDAVARRAVGDWIEDCLAWCYDRHAPNGRFMNQGYLDPWPGRYPGVTVIAHPGTNLALWNVESHRLERSGRSFTIDGRPLVFFHYSSMGTDRSGAWYSLHPMPRRLAPLLLAAVFEPYFEAVAAVSRRLERRHGFSGSGSARAYDWRRVTWLSGWRAQVPCYREWQRLAGAWSRWCRSLR